MLRSAPRALRVIVQLLLLAVVVGAALLYAPPIGAVTGGTLQQSVAREAGGIDLGGPCERQREDVWNCVVYASKSSATTAYQLTRHGRRCWDATAIGIGSSPDLPRSLSGCAKLRDQVGI